ncbi:MAG: winged helix-turn-helix transcriptional regulator [Streptosporangiales bacterium]|nr:winged helix-turn-helix transcriptional regulator [Streptosporangiales bacterium]
MTAHGLIDTTEMYLKAIFELTEEGIVPLRARIAERLNQSGPTVSQTVARMERDGLVKVEGDRHLEFSPRGHQYAMQVMRKHRLAEVLLLDVLGLDWEHVHVEACRWEHVMSDDVERRIVALCDKPRLCPHGNPIPGLDELDVPLEQAPAAELRTAREVARPGVSTKAVIRRISERVQDDVQFMRELHDAGVAPSAEVTLTARSDDTVELAIGVSTLVLDGAKPDALFVAS